MTRPCTRRDVLTFLAAALFVIVALPLRAQTADVSGDWTFQVETAMGSGSPAITFKQDGEKLTGTYDGTLGKADFTGTIKGAAITFSFEVSAQGQAIDVTYTGTVDKNTMKGSVNMAGGQLSGSFTGTRK